VEAELAKHGFRTARSWDSRWFRLKNDRVVVEIGWRKVLSPSGM
jgi:hypothetical protein